LGLAVCARLRLARRAMRATSFLFISAPPKGL
jgi:hypothetical protein